MTDKIEMTKFIDAWRICPKHRPASKGMVDFETATVVSIFNVDYLERNLVDSLGIDASSSVLKYLTEKGESVNKCYFFLRYKLSTFKLALCH